MKFREIIRFEVAYQLRRRSTWLYFLVTLGLTFQMATEVFLDNARSGGYFFNGPFTIAAVSVIGSMLGLLIVAAVAGDAAVRDVQDRMEPLLHAAPLTKTAYLGGRFIGAFAVSALLLTAIPLGLLLASRLPGLEPELTGPFRPAAYLGSYLFLTLPNAFVISALLFSLALLSRRALASYVGAAMFFILPFFSNEFVAKLKGQWELAKHIDPHGFTVMSELSRRWTSAEKGTLLLALEGSLLSNRLLWFGIALTVLALTFLRYRMAHPASGGRRRPGLRRAAAQGFAGGATGGGVTFRRSNPVAAPPVRRAFGSATRLRQLSVIALSSLREIVTSWGAIVLAAVVMLTVVAGPELMEHIGVPLFPTTDQVISRFASTDDVTGFLAVFLIVFYAGELVWRERDGGMSALTDTTPVPDWMMCVGKFLGLTLVLLLFQAILMLGGILTQVRLGYYEFELGLYLKLLFGFQLSDYLLFAALALAVHVVVNHKYVGHMIVILAYALAAFAGEIGIEHNLLIYGSDPGWKYSDISGFGPYLTPFLWFKLYWGAWALLLAMAARLLWVRGAESGARARLPIAASRLTGTVVRFGAAAVGFILVLGAFIFYNTNVLNAYVSGDEQSERRAEYERRHGRYSGIPQPQLTATTLHVEIYPGRREATIRGTYELENREAVPIEAIHLATSSSVTTGQVEMDRGFAPALLDDELGYRIYELDRPLQPGESMRLTFAVRFAPRGFPNSGIDDAVVGNGTHIEQEWLPMIGYQASREIFSAGDRRKHGLPPREEIRSLEEIEARRDMRGSARIAFEAVIGTVNDQIAVAPGSLRRTWTDDGRRYFHYTTDAPIPNNYAIFSARYAVHRGRWNDVEIEIFHHPGHGWTVDRMIRSVQASLQYFSEHFGPYPHRQIRLVEAPGTGIGLRAHPVNIRYFEGFSMLNPEADHRNVDLPFGVVAHEVAHQWWGNQLTPARIAGAAVLSESLAWYSAISVVEEAHGSEHLRRFLDLMREAYLQPRPAADVPLLLAADWYLGYRKGPFAMYAVREYVGEERVNLALRRLLEKYGSGDPPLATSLDLYSELKAVTPESLHYLLVDLFEVNTFWQLSTKSARAERAAGNGWLVTLELSAGKIAVDARGRETERPMDDLVEIGIYGEAEEGGSGEPLYLERHRIRSGDQRITVRVPRRPARAGIDPRILLIDTSWRDNTVAVEERAPSQ